jgi:hypothetical protein
MKVRKYPISESREPYTDIGMSPKNRYQNDADITESFDTRRLK